MPGTFTGKVVPIKVKIGLRPNGHADHPDWTQLPMITNPGDEVQYMNGGWIYDKACGHQESRNTGPAGDRSPMGMQWGILLVSEAFANEAVATFPTTISKITSEADLQNFIESYCTAHLPEFRMDAEELQALKNERDLLVDLGQSTTDVDARITKALDPNDRSPGKRKMPGKLWDDMVAERSVDLSNEVTRRP